MNKKTEVIKAEMRLLLAATENLLQVGFTVEEIKKNGRSQKQISRKTYLAYELYKK